MSPPLRCAWCGRFLPCSYAITGQGHAGPVCWLPGCIEMDSWLGDAGGLEADLADGTPEAMDADLDASLLGTLAWADAGADPWGLCDHAALDEWEDAEALDEWVDYDALEAPSWPALGPLGPSTPLEPQEALLGIPGPAPFRCLLTPSSPAWSCHDCDTFTLSCSSCVEDAAWRVLGLASWPGAWLARHARMTRTHASVTHTHARGESE